MEEKWSSWPRFSLKSADVSVYSTREIKDLSLNHKFPRAEGRFGNGGGAIHIFPQEHHNLPLEAFAQPEVGVGTAVSLSKGYAELRFC